MNGSFPIRESTIFCISEFISRALGLLFLAKYVAAYGLAASGLFRMVLPVLGIAWAIGSVGLPQALTRLLSASEARSSQKIFRDHITVSVATALISIVLTIGVLIVLQTMSAVEGVIDGAIGPLILLSLPVLVITCISGTLRGMLVGLGMNFPPAAAQIVEICVRLLLVMTASTQLGASLDISGAEAGIYMITVSESTALVLLIIVFGYLVSTGRLPIVHRQFSIRQRLQTLWSVLRMSLSPTAQALLTSVGYAIELPLAEYYLAPRFGPHSADVMIAEYAAVAVPLLCAPMFVTDGMSTALLPALTARRAQHGMASLRWSLYNTVRAVMLVSIPSTAALYVLAPLLCSWFGAAGATSLLCFMAPLAFPLYLQAPLASILQAQGRGRALLYASLYGDIVRIGALFLFVGEWEMALSGLMLAFTMSVLLQTLMLFAMTTKIVPIPIPWTTLWYSILCSVVVGSFLLIGIHTPSPLSIRDWPAVWMSLSCLVALFFLLAAGELSPRTLGKIPFIGTPVRKTAELVVSRIIRPQDSL